MARLLKWNEELSYPEIEALGLKSLNDGAGRLFIELGFLRSFARGEGTYIWDVDGNRYMDFLANFGVLNLGHNPPSVVRAIRESLDASICTFMLASLHKHQAILAHNLTTLAPGELQRVYYCNSGAESVEAAIKFARAATGRTRLVSIEKAFHGKTMGSLSVSGNAVHQEPFLPLLPGCKSIPLGDLSALKKEISQGDVAAFFFEPVLGEGGVLLHPDGWLQEVQDLCRHHGTLFVADEVQTGLGRTGKLFAVDHDGLKPDIICLAKSLSGGVIPIGATLTTDEVWQAAMGGPEKAGRHSSTFAGSALACVAGIAALEAIVEGEIPSQAEAKGRYFMERLEGLRQSHDEIIAVRGKGLLLGVEFRASEEENLPMMTSATLMSRHRIATYPMVNHHSVLRIEPPLTVTHEQIDIFVESLADAVASGAA